MIKWWETFEWEKYVIWIPFAIPVTILAFLISKSDLI